MVVANVPVKEIVPELVIGPPVVVNPVVPPETPTEVTVPVVTEAQLVVVPLVVRNFPELLV